MLDPAAHRKFGRGKSEAKGIGRTEIPIDVVERCVVVGRMRIFFNVERYCMAGRGWLQHEHLKIGVCADRGGKASVASGTQ